MAVSKQKQDSLELEREIERTKKMKEKKLDKKILKAFKKINNKNCYAFFKDSTNKSHHNLLQFLTLLEKRCENRYGKAKKYKKTLVYNVLHELIPNATKRQVKTLNAINRYMRKDENPSLGSFKFKNIFKGKDWSKLENVTDESVKEVKSE